MMLTCTCYHSGHITEGRQRSHCREKFVFTVGTLFDGESPVKNTVDKWFNVAAQGEKETVI